MAESIKSKRVFFSKGEQSTFILRAKAAVGLTWEKMAITLKTSSRNLIDWKNEKSSMPLSAVRSLCKRMKIKIPDNIETRDAYWYVQKGAKKGGLKVYEKYGQVGGDPSNRIKKWKEWWKREGMFKDHEIFQSYPFKKPAKSKILAEFIGVLLGDGGITKNQIKITLHCIDDMEYSKFIEALVTKLFSLKPSKIKKKGCQVFNITISRTGLVKFVVEKLGMKIGNKIKQHVDIPDWIKQNKKYRIACLRGLVDTDGCLIMHKYKSKGKAYCYKKIGFTSRSYPLLKSVSDILNELGIKHRIARGGFDIRVEAKKDVEKYFKVVGSSNPKHSRKYTGMQL